MNISITNDEFSAISDAIDFIETSLEAADESVAEDHSALIEHLYDALASDNVVLQDIVFTDGRCPVNATPVATRSHSIDQVLQRMMNLMQILYIIS